MQQKQLPPRLRQHVLGALATLGSSPVDVLVWYLDVACLAVNAAGWESVLSTETLENARLTFGH